MIRAKLEQAAEILDELGVDLWMIFTRESSSIHDPCIDLVVGNDVVWNAAFLISRTGERIAIMGSLDTGPHQTLGHFSPIIGYVEGISEPLIKTLRELDPKQIAIDYSLDDEMSDGLTYGQYLLLTRILKDTPFADRLISAEGIVARLRGRKIDAELQRIERACVETVDLFEQLHSRLRTGLTEREIAAIITEIRNEKGLPCAWDEGMCPAVFTGPETQRGHNGPSDRTMEPGHLMSVDFGMRYEGFCSDLQRTWYCLRPGEDEPPEAVRKAFATERDAIQRAAEALRPGVRGRDVDAVARDYIKSLGFDDYAHALGHQIGRQAHDGAGLLCPEWERYGDRPYSVVEEGQCYTLEPSVHVPGFGVATMEEVVVVTADGARFLSQPQEEILLVRGDCAD
jgi:Xaa-Pro aminopeptidase